MLGLFILCAAAFSGATALVDIRNCCCPNRLSYTVISEHVNWFEAFEACERRGLELVSITSQSEEDAIELTLGNDTNPIGAGFWTAATSLAAPSVFVWFTSGSELVYKEFPSGQPDNPNSERCVELFRQPNGAWKWNNHVCTVKKRYICQTKPNCCYFN